VDAILLVDTPKLYPTSMELWCNQHQ